MRRTGYTASSMRRIEQQLKTGGSYWIGTKNRYWFMARFKDVTGLDVELVKKGKHLYEIKIKSS